MINTCPNYEYRPRPVPFEPVPEITDYKTIIKFDTQPPAWYTERLFNLIGTVNANWLQHGTNPNTNEPYWVRPGEMLIDGLRWEPLDGGGFLLTINQKRQRTWRFVVATPWVDGLAECLRFRSIVVYESRRHNFAVQRTFGEWFTAGRTWLQAAWRRCTLRKNA